MKKLYFICISLLIAFIQSNAQEIKDNPLERIEADIELTKDPVTGKVPIDELVKAHVQVKASFKNNPKVAISGLNWVERGPNNIGGRTRALMFDPNDGTNKRVWAGGVAGGLWYNNDITLSTQGWTKVNDFWDNLAISCIAYSPANAQIFYVGTGEGWSNIDAVQGGGIWQTTDGGTTWNVLPATIPTYNAPSTQQFTFQAIQKIVVNPAGKVFAATQYGIWASIDNGNTWTLSFAPSGTVGGNENFCSDLEYVGGVLYAGFGRGNGSSVRKSIDNGANWINITPPSISGGRTELGVGTSTIYAAISTGGIGYFKKSIDGGVNWTDVVKPTHGSLFGDVTNGQAWYDLILSVHPANDNVLFIGGASHARTIDGGASWYCFPYTNPVHPDHHSMIFRPNSSNEMILGNDGGVYYSTNYGDNMITASVNAFSFAIRNKDYNVTQPYAVAMKNVANDDYLLSGNQDNGTTYTNSIPNTTGAGASVAGGDGMNTIIDQNEPNIIIGSQQFKNHFTVNPTTNAFHAYLSPQDHDGNGQQDGYFLNPCDYDHTNNIFYANVKRDGAGGNTYPFSRSVVTAYNSVTSNLVNVTTAIGNMNLTFIKASPYNAHTIYFGTASGRLFKVTGMNTGTPTATQLTQKSGAVSCIEIGASDNQLILTHSSYNVTSVWYSTDGGTTWTDKDEVGHGLPNIPVRYALFNPLDRRQVLLATELGVWSTTDINATNPSWQATNQNLANVRCDMLKFRTADNTVAVATHGRGVFTTTLTSSLINITSFSPTSGAIGTTVTITGTNFNTTPSQNVVFFGATKATVSAASASSLTVTVPVGATFQPITVLNLAIGATASSAVPFKVTYLGGSIVSNNFAPKVDFAASTEALNMAMGDLDGDGKSDLVTANFSANTISVLRNTSTSGSVSFAAKVDVATNTNPRGIAIGDLDGDGKPEVVITNFNSNNGSIYRNTSTSGSISFATKVDFTTGTGPRSVNIGDFDGDGKPDLAIANAGNVMSVLKNNSSSGSLSFQAKIDFALTAGNSSVAINSADFDGDGKLDIAVANNGLNTVSVFRNISAIGVIDASSFATKVDFTTGAGPFSLSTGDFDGDNKPDLAVANFSGNSISVLRNNATSGTISFEAKVDFVMGATASTSSTNVADIDGDGKLDLLALNLSSNQVSIFRNTATSGSITAGSFAAKVDFTTATGPRFVCIGDLDGDNRPDMAVTTQTSNVVSVLRYVEVVSNPTVPTTQTTCSGNTASLSATCAVGTVNWYDYLGVAIPFVGSPFVTPVLNANSLYKVRCEGLTTSAFVDVWVTVNPKPTAPTITASGPTTFCNGGSVTLNSNMGNNNAINFARVNNQYVTVPHSASLNLTTSFTMEAWVNYSGSNATILDKGNYDYLWSLNANGNGNKMGFYELSTGTWKYSNDPVPQNTWTHVAIVFTGNTIFFFINGLPSGAAGMTISQDNQPLNIGRQQPTACACNHFNGTMDELRIWNVARTYSQIIDNMNNTIPSNSAGLVAYYKFDEGTGTSTADATSNGNNGTLVNNPTWQVASPLNTVSSNSALNFVRASSQYVTVPHSASLNLSTSFTMEAWVNYSGTNSTIIDKGNYNYLWQLNANGNTNQMGFFILSSGTWVYSTGAVPQNTWTHVAITLNAGTLTFYINGVASGTAAVTIGQDTEPMNIGRQQPTFCACNHFNGTMDELRIWNVVRTPTQILENMNNTIPTNSAGLVAYYKFDEGTGTTTADATSNGNNGTLVNSPTWQVLSPINAVVWSPGGATTPSLTVTTAGTYTATVTNGYGCSSTASVVVSVGSNSASVPLASPADDYTTGTILKTASSANGKITATNKVTGSAKVDYRAKSIELNNGFKADGGTVFSAAVGGCN